MPPPRFSFLKSSYRLYAELSETTDHISRGRAQLLREFIKRQISRLKSQQVFQPDHSAGAARMCIDLMSKQSLITPSCDALILPTRELRYLLDRQTWTTPDLGQDRTDFSLAEPICRELTFRAARNWTQPPIDDPSEHLGKPGPVSGITEVEFGEAYCVIFWCHSVSRDAVDKRSHGIEIMSTVDERGRCAMNAACQACEPACNFDPVEG